MAGRRSVTFATFAVTFEVPAGGNLKDAREFIKEALEREKLSRQSDTPFHYLDMSTVKIHLTNKEVKYGKRS